MELLENKTYGLTYGEPLENTLDAIRTRTPFDAGNMWGQADLAGKFEVVSYNKVVASYIPESGWKVTTTKRSRMATRHANIVRTALAGHAEYTEEEF